MQTEEISRKDPNTIIICGVPIKVPEPPSDKKLIAGWELPAHAQKWKRTELPEIFKKLPRVKPETHLTKAHWDFIDQEFERREKGYWFYNNGVPTYITGIHYFYINWWKIDIGHPKYRAVDRDYFYFWNMCENDPDCYGMVEATRRRQGKCFAKGTLIRMHDGSVRPVQNIKEGEFVMGDDGSRRRAYGITTGREEMFKITPNRGEGFTCNKSHILHLVYNKGCRNLKYGWNPNDNVNITVGDYVNLPDNLKNHLCLYRNGWGSEYTEKQHILPPYVLGVYLGDGTSHDGSIANPDEEIRDELKKYAESKGLKFVVGADGLMCRISQPGYIKTDSGGHLENWGINPYRQALRDLNVLKNKHIPNEYVVDSEKNRLEILAGLIDTDGYLEYTRTQNRSYEITQKNKAITDGIVEIARSLGFYVSVSEKIAVLKRSGKEDYKCLVYRIRICGDIYKIPCRVERKKAIQTPPSRVNNKRHGFKVESIGEGDYYGFAVDGNHLFLLADGMVVHNTFRSGVILYEYISRNSNANGGVQSKTGPDAYKMFSKSVVSPWRSLPFFFKPNFDNTSNPKKELRFFAPARRGSKISSEVEEDELQSQIDARASTETAYDGDKLHRYVMDEIGKPTPDVNVDERWDIAKKCLQVDGEIVGKCIGTTTVEELSPGAGNDHFKAIWDASNYYERDENNQTRSGLYRFFMPAYIGYKLDEYGNDLIEESKKFQQATFDSLKNSPKKLASEKRKMPWSEADMFRIDSARCHFDSIKIQDRYDQLEAMSVMPFIAGKLEWVNGVKNTKVEFIPCMHDIETDIKTYCPVCRFLVAYLPPEGVRNNVVSEGYGAFNFFTPKNQIKFSAGCDPFQNKITMDDSRASNAAMYVKMKYDPLIDTDDKSVYDHITNRPVVEYINRPKDMYAFYDDVIKMIWFFGCELFPETNKPGLKYWMQENGYQNFLTIKPEGITKESDALRAKQDGGGASTTPMISHYTDLIEYDVNQNVHKYPFPRLLADLLAFDNSATQKYDPSVAWGYTLVGCEKKVIKREEVNEIRFIALYDSEGNRIE